MLRRNGIFKLSVLSWILFTGQQALALRTAIFPEEIRARAVIWQDQDKVFTGETPIESERPLWIHVGDSIATAWGSNDTLAELLKKAEINEIPQPGSVPDLFSHVPNPAFTWYAGSALNGGALFGFIEKRSKKTWVLISTSLAGSMISQKTQNPLQLPLEIKNLHRAQLVTISLGSNDLCSAANPFADPETDPKNLLAALKAQISSDAKIFAFAIPPIKEIYQKISIDIAALPDSIGKRRVQIYCQQMWEELNCPSVKDPVQDPLNVRQKIMAAYAEAGVHIIDAVTPTRQWSSVDLMSSDCFHPSKKTQKILFEESARVLDHEYFGSPH